MTTDIGLYTLTIGRLRQSGLHSGVFYRNDLFITNRIEDVERFKSPFRIDAVTVLVCTGGEMDCSVNLQHYHICSNMILVNLPDDIIQIHHSEALEAYAVLISTELLANLEIDFGQRSDFYLGIRQNAACGLSHPEVAALKPYYALLYGNIGEVRAETPEIVRGIVHAFSYTVISMMRVSRSSEQGEGSAELARSKRLFNKFIALVKAHHGSARGVKFYADRLCLTPNYLSGVIKEYTGKTATEWVNEYVILEAKILLRDSDASIQEIAYRLKFPSQSAFGKYFKQQVGIGPREFRQGAR